MDAETAIYVQAAACLRVRQGGAMRFVARFAAARGGLPMGRVSTIANYARINRGRPDSRRKVARVCKGAPRRET
jgi:hypothetical protein